MGAITIEKSNSLFWLGRYIERVFITTRYYSQLFDVMLDKNSEVYHDYCKKLDINDFYYNDAHFMMSYLYDSDNIDSIFNFSIAFSKVLTEFSSSFFISKSLVSIYNS